MDFGSNSRFESSDVSVKAFVVSHLGDLHNDLAEEIRECRDGFGLLDSSDSIAFLGHRFNWLVIGQSSTL